MPQQFPGATNENHKKYVKVDGPLIPGTLMEGKFGLVWFGLVYSCSIDLQQALTSAVRYRTSQVVEVHQCILTCFTVT